MSSTRWPERVAVLILSWNGRQHLATCLEALADQDDPGVPWQIVVLDNGSSDGSAAWLATHHPGVRLIRSAVNLGFCAGNNRLVEAVDVDGVVLLNNDTRPARGWLRALVEAGRNAPSDVAAISGLILDWAGERLDFGRGVMTFDGHAFQLDFRRPIAAARIPAEGSELPFACGGNLLIRRCSYLDAGGFDESYFAYLEDVDLGWRLWSGGERVLFAPAAVVHHRSSATSDLLGNFNRGLLFERNAFLTAYKNYDASHWPLLMPAVLMTLLARTQALLVRNNPGGAELALDPYAGLIADTAPGAPPAPPLPGIDDGRLARLRRAWQQHPPREFLRRGLSRLLDHLLGGATAAPAAPQPPQLTDPRSISQLRALSYLVGHLDQAEAKRRVIQARRRRPDAELFERFPLYVVPTYPGDEELFAGSGFKSWLPREVPFTRTTLSELMEWG